MTPYNIFFPKEHTEFWCSSCDAHLVDSTNEKTGHFYVQFGHLFNQDTLKYDGDYRAVMFALCSHCERK